MTVFPDGTKERLHGHNYYLSVTVELHSIAFAEMVDFSPIKAAIAMVCQGWKEHTLLATLNPYYEVISDTDTEIEFLLCKSRYVLPKEDVVLLPIDNLAVEPLSELACKMIVQQLGDILVPGVVESIEVTVEENPGQGASTRHQIERV